MGTSGNDLINGKGGHDTIWGMNGSDVLIGGSGKDTFVFASAGSNALKLGSNNVDVLVDFNAADDTIQLGDSVFTKLADRRPLVERFRGRHEGVGFQRSDHLRQQDRRSFLRRGRHGLDRRGEVRRPGEQGYNQRRRLLRHLTSVRSVSGEAAPVRPGPLCIAASMPERLAGLI